MPPPLSRKISLRELIMNLIQRSKVVKLVIGGDGGVGKTTLIHRYIDGEYLEGKITIGSDFRVKELMNGHELRILLQIWDLGGQERFRFITPDYCRGADFGFLCFAMDDKNSFKNLDEWYNIFVSNAPQIKILLIGTKCDLDSAVSLAEIQTYMNEKNLMGFFETSSKTNIGIDDAFKKIPEIL